MGIVSIALDNIEKSNHLSITDDGINALNIVKALYPDKKL